MNKDYQLLAPRAQAALAMEPYTHWDLPDGRRWTEFYRLDNHYLLRFPGLVDFFVQADDWSVSGYPVDGVTAFTVEHLYLNQVLPLVLSAQGRQVYHASAVVIDDAAIAFMGESGRGKSTLAAAFAVAGKPFLTDDGLVVECSEDGHFLALPSHPSIRLWADSADALVPAGAECAPAVQYSPKARFLASEALVFSANPVPLRRVFYLGDDQAEKPRIEPLSARDAMTQLVRHSFLLDFDARARLQSHFTETAALANQPLHYQLDYPRSFKALDNLRATILEHIEAAGQTDSQ